VRAARTNRVAACKDGVKRRGSGAILVQDMSEGDTIFRAARTLHRALAGKVVTRFESKQFTGDVRASAMTVVVNP
jgi:hypothetical protein